MDFFNILHGLLTEKKFIRASIKEVRPTSHGETLFYKLDSYVLEIWVDRNINSFMFEFTDTVKQSQLSFEELDSIINRSNQITQEMLADPSFDPQIWLSEYLRSVGLNG